MSDEVRVSAELVCRVLRPLASRRDHDTVAFKGTAVRVYFDDNLPPVPRPKPTRRTR